MRHSRCMKFFKVFALSMTMIMAGVIGLPTAGADSQAAVSLSLEDAISKAMAYSPDLKAAQFNIDIADRGYEKAVDPVKYIPATGANQSPEGDVAWKSLLQSSISQTSAKQTYNANKAKLQGDVFSAYFTVNLNQATVDKDKAVNDSDQQALKAARASFSVGLLTKAQVTAAEAAAEASAKTLAADQEALGKAYIALNKITGLPLDGRPTLTDQLVFTPFTVDNPATEASKAVAYGNALGSAGVTLNQAKHAVELAQLEADYPYTAYGTLQDYNLTHLAVNKAEMDVVSASNELRQSVLEMYHDIQSLEHQYDALQAQREAAEEALRVTRLQYEVGIVTLKDVKAAESGLAKVEGQLATTVFSHEILTTQFRLLTGAPVLDPAATAAATAATTMPVTATTPAS